MIMRKFLSIFLLSSCQAFAALNPITMDIPSTNKISEELSLLDDLIDVTEKNLVAQKQLRKDIFLYQQYKQRYLKDMENRNAAYEMVQIAHRILEEINANYLIHVFPSDFISELSFFSQIASKKSP